MEFQTLLARNYTAERLFAEHPPVFTNRNKQAVFDIACPAGCKHRGELYYSRWETLPLPDMVVTSHWRTEVLDREDSFSYEPVSQSGLQEWYLNFANWDLFSDYGGPLLAQDEHQVAEHPILGALREALLAEGVPFGTTGDNEPTPVLIRNVERCCMLDTRPNVREGRPYGLYGTEFARARPDEVSSAVRPIRPPTINNILAIEAPAHGSGTYSAEEIRFILKTAYSGFSVARHESMAIDNAHSVAVHTGFWGCGAYGGNKVMMALLQIIAGNMAGLDRVLFHTFDASGTELFQQATSYLRSIAPQGSSMSMDELISRVVNLGLVWGESDGN